MQRAWRLQAYLAGLTFALAASPCSTPVLATLLAYVATSQDPLLGGGLLLAYTSGCATFLSAIVLFGNGSGSRWSALCHAHLDPGLCCSFPACQLAGNMPRTRASA